MNSNSEEVPIKNAATVVIRREIEGKPYVLMGQRGKDAVFMPNKFVFPGGAIDQQDHEVRLAFELEEDLFNNLIVSAKEIEPRAIIAGAIREVWEETGLRIVGKAETSGDTNLELSQWKSFSATGFVRFTCDVTTRDDTKNGIPFISLYIICVATVPIKRVILSTCFILASFLIVSRSYSSLTLRLAPTV